MNGAPIYVQEPGMVGWHVWARADGQPWRRISAVPMAFMNHAQKWGLDTTRRIAARAQKAHPAAPPLKWRVMILPVNVQPTGFSE